MTGLVDLIAPRSWLGALLNGIIFLILINILNFVITVGIRQVSYGFLADFVSTTFVALPFTALIMASLFHQRELQEKLTLLATTDMLTGLPNRRAFIARTTAATESGQNGALLLLDADHFKLINDTWGHAVGDVCLTAIAERLRRTLRPDDIVGRLGGEEFSIFLPGATLSQATLIGERLCHTIAVEAEGAGRDVRVTMSIGATFGENSTPLEKLMAQADHALYRAKAEGRARMIFWSDGTNDPPSLNGMTGYGTI